MSQPTNVPNLGHALGFLEQVVRHRCRALRRESDPTADVEDMPQLAYYDDGSAFSRFIATHEPSFDEYVVLLLGLVPHVAPGALDRWIREALPQSGDFPELGGKRDEHRAFVPTGQTAAFLLAGDDLARRFEVQTLFESSHWFAEAPVLALETVRSGEPRMSGRLLLDPEYVDLFTTGRVAPPDFGVEFPAREIRTGLEWEDLVLTDSVRQQIEEIHHWIDHQDSLRTNWGMARRLKPGYRAMFYGAPGVGKTVTATLLGKVTGRKVMRVDLSTVVSKFVGETEKNLASLFDKASRGSMAGDRGARKNWILFFDEADALFGKRTNVKDAHDRYANQEVSYLLQRVEEFDGLVILASNFKSNIDDAFLRRFNAVVRFPFPNEQERAEIWRRAFPDHVRFEGERDFPKLLAHYELAGGSIVNVVQHVCIEALTRNSDELRMADALTGVRREYEKEGRVFRPLPE